MDRDGDEESESDMCNYIRCSYNICVLEGLKAAKELSQNGMTSFPLSECCQEQVLVFQSDSYFIHPSIDESVSGVRRETKLLHLDVGAICQVPEELAVLVFGSAKLCVVKCCTGEHSDP